MQTHAVKRRRVAMESGCEGVVHTYEIIIFRIPRENARNAGKHRRANVARSLCER